MKKFTDGHPEIKAVIITCAAIAFLFFVAYDYSRGGEFGKITLSFLLWGLFIILLFLGVKSIFK